MSRVRIVLGSGSLAGYPEGGGLWAMFLQYLLGLNALGHDVCWLELFWPTGDAVCDQRLIRLFLDRFRDYGMHARCALLQFAQDAPCSLEHAEVYGLSRQQLREIVQSADVLWNFACAVQQPLLSQFKRSALLDGDPGHLQISAQTWDLGVADHDTFFTVGMKLHDADCKVPTLGRQWHRFFPPLYLPMWTSALASAAKAPFTSITEWEWEQLWFDDQMLSVSKRDAYLGYLELPRIARRPFELAVNFHPDDSSGDRELLHAHGWTVVHPHQLAASPAAFQSYLARSRAEICCPKPIHRALRTGWFSDRSACYLASGRPVLVEDTGFGEYLPTGAGVVVFRSLAEAVAGVSEIDANYARHCRTARELAEAYFDSRRNLEAMLNACC